MQLYLPMSCCLTASSRPTNVSPSCKTSQVQVILNARYTKTSQYINLIPCCDHFIEVPWSW